MARAVFITGASGGIGAALARYYCAAGAVVGLVARRASTLRDIAAALPAGALTCPIDVRDSAAMNEAAEDFIARQGCPDLVIANAGLSRGTLTAKRADLSVFQEIIETNVMSLPNTFHPFLDPMQRRASGALVGIASVAGYCGLLGAGAYCASKSAAITYLESLRLELWYRRALRDNMPGIRRHADDSCQSVPHAFHDQPDEFARRLDRAVRSGKDYAVIPWQMAIVARVLHILPYRAFEWLFAGAPRKPR